MEEEVILLVCCDLKAAQDRPPPPRGQPDRAQTLIGRGCAPAPCCLKPTCRSQEEASVHLRAAVKGKGCCLSAAEAVGAGPRTGAAQAQPRLWGEGKGEGIWDGETGRGGEGKVRVQ